MSLAKSFETKFKKDWMATYDNGFCYRLPDQMSGYVKSSNVCDFICFNKDTLFLIECKTIKGNTFPLDNLTQYDNMSEYMGRQGIRIGVVLWYYDHEDSIYYVPIKVFKEAKIRGDKSLNIKNIEELGAYRIPSKKKRTYYDSDYSILMNLKDGE